MVELTSVILALSIEILAGDILAQLLKAINGEMTAWPSSYRFIAARELYCLARPMHSKVLTPIL